MPTNTNTRSSKKAELKKKARQVFGRLQKTYPDAHCALDYETPFQLLSATILSAQCTDVRVNMVTPELFRRFPDPSSMAKASQEDLEELVRSTGFYRNKAKSLREMAQGLVERFGGEVPASMEELLTLRGVARKTANVVLGNALDIHVGVVVDTHIGRLSRRLGWSKEKDPVKVERDLMALFPQHHWTLLAHLLIAHGRQVCKARNPACSDCVLSGDCPRVGVE